MEQELTALWFDGESAEAYCARVQLLPAQRAFRIIPECSTASDEQPAEVVWLWSDIVSSSHHYDDVPLRLLLQPDTGQRLVFTQAHAAETAAAWLQDTLTVRKQRNLRRWLIAGVAIWLSFAALYFGSPFVCTQIARAMPRSWEVALGQASRDQVVVIFSGSRRLKMDYDCPPALQNNLDALVQRLKSTDGAEGYDFSIQVIKSDIINAVALPGGFMFVTTGLIADCESPDELAGVIAHEMAHITRQHGVSQMLQAHMWQILGSIITGTDFFSQFAGDVVVLAITSSYSRASEREADTLGAKRLYAANINPNGLPNFFKRLETKEVKGEKNFLLSMTSYVASHPEYSIREQYLLEYVNSLPPTEFTPAIPLESWTAMRSLAEEATKPLRLETEKLIEEGKSQEKKDAP